MRVPVVASFAMLVSAIPAQASSTDVPTPDLSVAAVRVQHAIQLGESRLAAGRSGWVRVMVETAADGHQGREYPVPGVDAVMHVFLDGEAIPGSPFFSLNGPIDAPAAPTWGDIDHTVNFPLLIPSSGVVSIVIELNPFGAVIESEYANNTTIVDGLEFVCAELVDLAFVPIDYTLGGGLPDEALTRPGIGDNFVQAVFGSGGVLYHRAPVTPLVWNEPIGSTMPVLLGALQELRLNHIPANGFPRPDFVYGWLADNPFWGNGAAIGVPGDVAAGNTAPDRFQRTFAHEIGHLVGRQHVTPSAGVVGTIGIDVEHHLLDTEDLPQLVPAERFDVMVAGKLTKEAWVNDGSWHAFIDDARFECGARAADDGSESGGAPDGVWIAGRLDHEVALLAIAPLMPLWRVEPTNDDPEGDTRVELLRDGKPLYAVRLRTGTARELCVAPGPDGVHPLLPSSWLSVVVPATLFDVDAMPDTVRAVRIVDGAILGERWRSGHAPESVEVSVGITLAQPETQGRRGGVASEEMSELTVSWGAVDLDGDALTATVLYSPDGAWWTPLRVRASVSPVGVALGELPAGKAGHARVRVIVGDGFDWVVSEFPIDGAVGAGSAPEVHLVSPNDGSIHLQHGGILLHAAGWDLDDGLLPSSSILWTSSIDGPVGAGRLLLHAGLSPGVHAMTATGTDSDGLESAETVWITVEPRTLRPADLDGDGAVNGADLALMLLAWGPCAACSADLNGDGAVDGTDLGLLTTAWTG